MLAAINTIKITAFSVKEYKTNIGRFVYYSQIYPDNSIRMGQ